MRRKQCFLVSQCFDSIQNYKTSLIDYRNKVDLHQAIGSILDARWRYRQQIDKIYKDTCATWSK